MSNPCPTGLHALRWLPIAALASISFLATTFAAATTAARGSEWLNVRELGASGSRYETTAAATAGSKQIAVAKVGDFRVGQGVIVSKCNIRYTQPRLWGAGQAYYNSKPVGNSVEVRGYDGTAGSWLVYVLDIAPSAAPAFRWTEDLGRTWQPAMPVTGGWQRLSRGIEVRLNPRDWQTGYVIAFGARDQLVSRIEKIEGNVLTLRDAANRTVADALLRHCDDEAIRATIDRALREKRNVYVPVGHYRLARELRVSQAEAITIEGASAVDTLLDISDGEGSCFTLAGGTEVTLRNFRMVGFMGFDEADRAGHMRTQGASGIWGFALKYCAAVSIAGTQQVLVENCHGTRMSGECFVSGGPSRATAGPGRPYSQAITYLRCSVTDSARNAFNDVMCGTENTCVLNCRVENVGGCSWEGASRFVKFTGNYVRNSGTVAMGNLGPANRDKSFDQLGAGQHIIADNVFESGVSYGGRVGGTAIVTSVGSTQVIIRNNLFVNFNSSPVMTSGRTDSTHYPSANTTITGNIFDLTCVGPKPLRRTAVDVSANETIVSGNQIYVRGVADPLVTAIRLHEPALNVTVHDNLIRNCGLGIGVERGQGKVREAPDGRTLLRAESPDGLPLERRQPELTRGWSLVWAGRGKPAVSVIEAFDPESLRFTLREPREMKPSDVFDVIAPSVNWLVHDNTLTGCLRPLVLNGYGSPTSILRNNVVTRGDAAGVTAAVEVRGMFRLVGNQISGFDEPGSAALAIYLDPLERVRDGQYRQNVLARCAAAVSESQPGLWTPADRQANTIVDCGRAK